MKKILLLSTAALLVTGITFAEKGKKKKSCAKGKTCCSKSASTAACKDKSKTAKL